MAFRREVARSRCSTVGRHQISCRSAVADRDRQLRSCEAAKLRSCEAAKLRSCEKQDLDSHACQELFPGFRNFLLPNLVSPAAWSARYISTRHLRQPATAANDDRVAAPCRKSRRSRVTVTWTRPLRHQHPLARRSCGGHGPRRAPSGCRSRTRSCCLRVAALLVLQDRKRLDGLVPRGEPAVREVAVDAAHVGLAELHDLVEYRLRVLRARVVGVDQDREAPGFRGFRHWLSFRSHRSGTRAPDAVLFVAGIPCRHFGERATRDLRPPAPRRRVLDRTTLEVVSSGHPVANVRDPVQPVVPALFRIAPRTGRTPGRASSPDISWTARPPAGNRLDLRGIGTYAHGNADVAQWQSTGLPGSRRGFDSRPSAPVPFSQAS